MLLMRASTLPLSAAAAVNTSLAEALLQHDKRDLRHPQLFECGLMQLLLPVQVAELGKQAGLL